jgi:hypothetical protein
MILLKIILQNTQRLQLFTKIIKQIIFNKTNRTAHIRHQCMKTTVFSCHRCLINTGVEKNELHLNIDYNQVRVKVVIPTIVYIFKAFCSIEMPGLNALAKRPSIIKSGGSASAFK